MTDYVIDHTYVLDYYSIVSQFDEDNIYYNFNSISLKIASEYSQLCRFHPSMAILAILRQSYVEHNQHWPRYV